MEAIRHPELTTPACNGKPNRNYRWHLAAVPGAILFLPIKSTQESIFRRLWAPKKLSFLGLGEPTVFYIFWIASPCLPLWPLGKDRHVHKPLQPRIVASKVRLPIIHFECSLALSLVSFATGACHVIGSRPMAHRAPKFFAAGLLFFRLLIDRFWQ